MEILKKIENLKKTIQIVDEMVDELTNALEAKNLKLEKQENKLSSLKEEIKSNVLEIDAIIEEYNANTKS
jgi:predicted  nucleic acid-binding Zn-ribbon protein